MTNSTVQLSHFFFCQQSNTKLHTFSINEWNFCFFITEIIILETFIIWKQKIRENDSKYSCRIQPHHRVSLASEENLLRHFSQGKWVCSTYGTNWLYSMFDWLKHTWENINFFVHNLNSNRALLQIFLVYSCCWLQLLLFLMS